MSNKAVPSTCRHETLIRSREYSLLQLEEKHLALTLSGFTLRKNYLRPLHGVMSGTRIRQKFAKKRRLRGVKSIFRKILTQLSCRVVAMQRSRKAINKIHHTWFTVARIIGIQRKTVWLKKQEERNRVSDYRQDRGAWECGKLPQFTRFCWQHDDADCM